MAVSSPVGDVKIVSPISAFVLNALTLKETEERIFFFWSSLMVNLLQPVRLTKTLPVRSTTQICVVTRHQYCARFSKVISRGETSSGVVKCRLFPRTSTRRHEEAQAGFSPSRVSLRSRLPAKTNSSGTGKQLNRCFGRGNTPWQP